ncbi:lysophospholipid acyltransferase family protein [Luteibacter sp. CQ10]|uniref:lysophospholipid acyltransferase family protein n=1 Tax=Luteibacter sp. CQ10 TaxID=2805821 RepID=UPI0034A186D9
MIDALLVALTRGLVGAQPSWTEELQKIDRPCIYFANHTSHLDTLAIWSAFPHSRRRSVRPVAAADYWKTGGLRSYIADHVLRAIYVDRKRDDLEKDPLAPIGDALSLGDSIIMFPEGTRGRSRLPGPFKSGLYRLARRHPDVVLVPVYLDTLHRSLPKGCVLPLPIQCTVNFGKPTSLSSDESKEAFLTRAHAAVVSLAGTEGWA